MAQPLDSPDVSAFAAQLPRLSGVEAGGLLQSACATWPQVECAPAAFGQFLVRQLGTGDWRQWHVADLYLAWGVLEGQAAAVRTFDQLLTSWATLALRGRTQVAVDIDEALSRLRTRLLLDTAEKPAGLRQYSGQGSLKAWVIVSALRSLHDVTRGTEHAGAADALEFAENLAHAQQSAESRLHTAKLEPHLRQALERSLSALPVRLRTVMRLHYVDGVSAERLAQMYGVHRATTTRWLTDARQQVLDATHAHLAEVLGPETLSSMKRQLSAFELSIVSLFTEVPEL